MSRELHTSRDSGSSGSPPPELRLAATVENAKALVTLLVFDLVQKQSELTDNDYKLLKIFIERSLGEPTEGEIQQMAAYYFQVVVAQCRVELLATIREMLDKKESVSYIQSALEQIKAAVVEDCVINGDQLTTFVRTLEESVKDKRYASAICNCLIAIYRVFNIQQFIKLTNGDFETLKQAHTKLVTAQLIEVIDTLQGISFLDEMRTAQQQCLHQAQEEQATARLDQETGALAIRARLEKEARQLLRNSPNKAHLPRTPNEMPDEGESRYSKIMVKDDGAKLIEAGIDINIQDNIGGTLLHYAMERKNWRLVDILLNRGAELSIKNQAGQTPVDVFMAVCLDMPAQDERADETLLRHALHALKNGDSHLMNALLIRGIRLDIQDCNGQYCVNLLSAAELKTFLLGQSLANVGELGKKEEEQSIELGMALATETGNTPLHWAIYHHQWGSLRLIITLADRLGCLNELCVIPNRSGEDCLHITDRNGNSIFHLAASRVEASEQDETKELSSEALMQKLVQLSAQDAQIEIQDSYGMYAKRQAPKPALEKVKQTLLKPNADGKTPLHIAMETQRWEWEQTQLVNRRYGETLATLQLVMDYLREALIGHINHRRSHDFQVLLGKLKAVEEATYQIYVGEDPNQVFEALKTAESIQKTRHWYGPSQPQTVQLLNRTKVIQSTSSQFSYPPRQASAKDKKENPLHVAVREQNHNNRFTAQLNTIPMGDNVLLLYGRDGAGKTPMELLTHLAVEPRRQRERLLPITRLLNDIFRLVYIYLEETLQEYMKGSSDYEMLKQKRQVVDQAYHEIIISSYTQQGADLNQEIEKKLRELVHHQDISKKRNAWDFWKPPQTQRLLQDALQEWQEAHSTVGRPVVVAGA
ncbi:MAG: hypothetical protein A3F41_02300 [Coxiella sp. RIFCSPHIGHO2_12_FULL_44_14]|nr:MAG: hypothetical protein A3F41_02300 [Coxiella sp. RIFCSPHIGHO2_12_FULL_44_14]